MQSHGLESREYLRSERRHDVRFAEVVSLVKERLAGHFGECVGEAVVEVQADGVGELGVPAGFGFEEEQGDLGGGRRSLGQTTIVVQKFRVIDVGARDARGGALGDRVKLLRGCLGLPLR